MSRTIKFRAWDEKNKQFADYEDIEECLSCQNRHGWRSSDGMGCCFGINAVEILADCIIEQYTGLKDKNGKEIYEGDIVEFGLSGRAERGYVAYADEYASFEVYSKRGFIFGYLFSHAGNVIGNIHENPELLGGKE